MFSWENFITTFWRDVLIFVQKFSQANKVTWANFWPTTYEQPTSIKWLLAVIPRVTVQWMFNCTDKMKLRIFLELILGTNECQYTFLHETIFTWSFTVITCCTMLCIFCWCLWRWSDTRLTEWWFRSRRVLPYRFLLFALVFSFIPLLKHLSPRLGTFKITTITKLQQSNLS